MSFSLSASLDRKAIHADFVDRGYAQVLGVLPEENARRIHKELAEVTPWNLVFNEDGKHFDLPEAQLNLMKPGDKALLIQAIYARAKDNFQYYYYNYPIFDSHKAGLNKDLVLHQFYEWLDGEEFLSFSRQVTGFDDIAFVDAQATSYRRGQFLSTHDDTLEGKNRRAAYIFNFTREWRSDWGGYLQLLSDDDNVRAGLRPAFNTLNIVAIPQRHNVGIVSPFAGGPRLSVSGWIRSNDPDQALSLEK